MEDNKKIIMKKKLADELMDMLSAVYISALISAKDVKNLEEDLTLEDWESASNYARSKFIGITSEFELDGYRWCIVDD